MNHDNHLLLHVGFDGYSSAWTPDVVPVDAASADITVDLDDIPGSIPLQTILAQRLTLVARTATDLRRAVVLDDLLPDVSRIDVVILALASWRVVPLPSACDEDLWRRGCSSDLYRKQADPWRAVNDVHLRRLPTRGWLVEMHFDEPVPSGLVLASFHRSLEGRRIGTAAPLAGPAGPGLLQSHRYRAYAGDEIADSEYVTRSDLVRQHRGSLAPRVTTFPLVAQVPPIDILSINPLGFRRATDDEVGILEPDGPSHRIRRGTGPPIALPASGNVTELEVERLRPLTGLWLAQPPADGPTALGLTRTVVQLAAAGIPLVIDNPLAWEPSLGAELTGLLTDVGVEDLHDSLRREQHSIRVRRHVLRRYGPKGRWREAVGMDRVPLLGRPRVTVVLCTKRPEMLAFALSQVGRQRDINVELVVGLHGVRAAHPQVSATLAGFESDVDVVEIAENALLGEALNHAARRSTGSFIAKMDDDDWYGPDHLADLVLAHEYSGADLVGCHAEFIYLEEFDTTVRRGAQSTVEVPSSMTDTGMVIGGTMLLPRTAFEEVGGFKLAPVFEDGELCTAVRSAGGLVHRQHGLNYLYRRRRPDEHTWPVTSDHFLTDDPPRWPGVYLNDLMH